MKTLGKLKLNEFRKAENTGGGSNGAGAAYRHYVEKTHA